MVRLHLTIEARTWKDPVEPRVDRARRARLAAALRDAAAAIENGRAEATIERPDLNLRYEISGPAPHSAAA
jgi:hypothetical protein